MKKLPSTQRDRNDDDILNVPSTISDNRNGAVYVEQQMKNVIELPDVWKRTNFFIPNKSSQKSTQTINDAYKLSFDFSSPNQGNNNNNKDTRTSLVKDRSQLILAGIEFGNSPSPDAKTILIHNNRTNKSIVFKFGYNGNENLLDVGVVGGFEYWDGSKPKL